MIYKILGVFYFLFLLSRLPETFFLVLWWGTSLLPKGVRVILTPRGMWKENGLFSANLKVLDTHVGSETWKKCK